MAVWTAGEMESLWGNPMAMQRKPAMASDWGSWMAEQKDVSKVCESVLMKVWQLEGQWDGERVTQKGDYSAATKAGEKGSI